MEKRVIAPIAPSEYKEILSEIRKDPANLDADLATIMRHRAVLETAPNDQRHNYLRHLVEARFCLIYALRNPGLSGPLNMLEDHLKAAGSHNGHPATHGMVGTSQAEIERLRQQAQAA